MPTISINKGLLGISIWYLILNWVLDLSFFHTVGSGSLMLFSVKSIEQAADQNTFLCIVRIVFTTFSEYLIMTFLPQLSRSLTDAYSLTSTQIQNKYRLIIEKITTMTNAILIRCFYLTAISSLLLLKY